MSAHDSLSDFAKSTVTELGVSREVYRIGATGPCVVVCHEIPGVTPEVADFCRHVAAQGFQVSCPVLVGIPGAPLSTGAAVRELLKVCISKEFNLFVAGASSPAVDWLRAFGKTEHTRCGGPGIGVVGMCFSGGFALAMAVDPHVLAPVMSQPANPVALPFGKRRQTAVPLMFPMPTSTRCALDSTLSRIFVCSHTVSPVTKPCLPIASPCCENGSANASSA
jgi:dienelactone hydrolase